MEDSQKDSSAPTPTDGASNPAPSDLPASQTPQDEVKVDFDKPEDQPPMAGSPEPGDDKPAGGDEQLASIGPDNESQDDMPSDASGPTMGTMGGKDDEAAMPHEASPTDEPAMPAHPAPSA